MEPRNDSDGISLRNNKGNSTGGAAGKGQCALMMEKFILREEKGVLLGFPLWCLVQLLEGLGEAGPVLIRQGQPRSLINPSPPGHSGHGQAITA